MLEEEQTNIEVDEFFNPPNGQPFQISKQNFQAQQALRDHLLNLEKSGVRQRQISRWVIDTSLTKKTNSLIAKESKQLREGDRKGIVFVADGEELIVYHQRPRGKDLKVEEQKLQDSGS